MSEYVWWTDYERDIFYHSTGLDPDIEDDEAGVSGWYFKLKIDAEPVGPYDSFEDAASCRRNFIEWELS